MNDVKQHDILYMVTADKRRKDQKWQWDETIHYSNQLEIQCRYEASQQYTAISCFVKSLSYLQELPTNFPAS